MMNKLNHLGWCVGLILIFIYYIGEKNGNSKIIKYLNSNDPKTNLNSIVVDSIIQKNKPTSQELYSEVEKLLGTSTHLKFDSLTRNKNYTVKIGDEISEILCYYTKFRLVRIENRVYNKKMNVLSFRIFDFDDKNCCITYSKKDVGEKGSRIYAVIYNQIIEYNSSLEPFILNTLQKQMVIQSAKSSLDSTMVHFPEFKYSLNWK